MNAIMAKINTPQNILHLAIVEDEPMMGKLIQEALINSDRKTSFVLYSSGYEALEGIAGAATKPDIVLMDIRLPDISGIELTAILKEQYPDMEIIVHTFIDDTETIMNAIKAGASGYLLKVLFNQEIWKAIEIVEQGGSFLTGRVAKKMLQYFQMPKKQVYGQMFALSDREEEILTDLVNGASYKEIVAKYNLSEHTVNTYIRRIYKKMQVRSRGEAVAKAISGNN